LARHLIFLEQNPLIIMKRFLFLLGLVACFSSPPARAEETPETQLEFVRKLRARGYADLALEYLEGMQKNASPTLASTLLLEQARTRTALARNLDPERRLALVNQAREELQEFLKKNPKGPESVAVTMELARLYTFQGQAMLSQALRQDNVKAQQQMAEPAEAMFIQAGKEITAVAKLLTDENDRRQAKFDLAINLMDQTRTYIDLGRSDLNLKRATIVKQARDVLEEIHKEDKKSPIGIMATAWLVKCCQEGDDPQNAAMYYKSVMNQLGKSAEPAQRWARYFRMEWLPRNPTIKLPAQGKFQEVQKEAQAWLKEYPAHHKSMPGYGVRFEYANALVNEALVIKEIGKDKEGKLQAAKLKQAQDILATLNEVDNDFAEKASQLNLSLNLQRVGDKASLTDLNNFEECYLRAQVEMAQVKKVVDQLDQAKSKEEADKLEKQRKDHFKNLTRALSRALSLADNRVAPTKLDDARYHLVVAYLMSGDMHRTAIAGEVMCKVSPPTKNSPLAAGYAIEAYANIFSRDSTDNNRARLRQLAEFVLSPENQKHWANESVTGVAHYQLAMLNNKEDKYQEAIAHLQKLPKNYSGYLFGQGQLIFIALEARDKTQKPEEKKALQDLARKTIASLPKLPANIDTSSATMYFHAQVEEAKFLYAEGAELLQKSDTAKALQKYQQMAQFVDGINKELQTPTLKLPDDTKSKLGFFLGTMSKYARLGMADVEYRAGNYDKVLAADLTGSVVDMVKKEAAKGGVIRLEDFQVTGEILGLALRANVQKGKVDEAKLILKSLENLKGPEDSALADSTGVLRNLVVELQVQIRDLQKAGNQEKLKKTVANFSEFLDALVKQSDKKGLDKSDLFFLARCYDSLDQHEKAAKLYARYPTPKFLDVEKKEKEKFTDEEEKELNTYWYVQVMQARQMRLAKKINESKKLLEFLMGHKNARQQLLAEKEQNHLLEDSGVYGTAITRWSSFMNNPSLKSKLGNDAPSKEMYFEAYYHLTYCWYKYSQTEKVVAAGKDAQFLGKAAEYIIRLETASNPEGWQIVGHKFRTLMETEKLLQDAYKRQKGV
jgi:hypothetical protein